MKDFRELLVWEKAHALTLAIYRATESFPPQEVDGLTSQLRRAAASIPANIVRATPSWRASCKLRWGLPAKSNTTCCSLVILACWNLRYTKCLILVWLRSSVCWPHF